MTAKPGLIHIGIGGWTYPPWRGVFYPPGLPHAQELRYAAERLTSIEVNGTFYRTQTPATFRKWARETPEGFVFSLKGPRYVTQRRDLSQSGEAIRRFLQSGVLELGGRLGPLLWQFPPTRKFDAAQIGLFLQQLPRDFEGVGLRHAIEVRHPSFATDAFVALLREAGVALVYADHATYPAIADLTADFVYARLQKGEDRFKAGYPPRALDAWSERLRVWSRGGTPADLPCVLPKAAPARPRDVFAYVIHEGKLRAPAAALALIERLR